MAPEYIGYGDVGLADGIFTAIRPALEKLPGRTFKYHVDFDHLNVDDSTGAICVSRPTNPTGNVLTDTEVAKLIDIAGQNAIPLIIDNAYGMPFPNIIFTDAELVWNDNIILSMSLSKLGLPGTRTGIIVARPDIIRTLSNINGILNLAPESVGPALAFDLVRSGEVREVSRTLIRPYYEEKAQRAMALLHEELARGGLLHTQGGGRNFSVVMVPRPACLQPGTLLPSEATGRFDHPGSVFFPRTGR